VKVLISIESQASYYKLFIAYELTVATVMLRNERLFGCNLVSVKICYITKTRTDNNPIVSMDFYW